MNPQNKKITRVILFLIFMLLMLLWIQHRYGILNLPVTFVTELPSLKGEHYSFTADTSLYHFTSQEGKMITRSNFFSSDFLMYFPQTIGEWNGEDIENPYADISLFRLYRHQKTGHRLWFILVYGSHESQFHSAEVCYLSDGWDILKREIKKVKLDDEEFPIRYMIAQKGDALHLVTSWYVWESPKRQVTSGTILFRISIEFPQNEYEGQQVFMNFVENLANVVMQKKSAPPLIKAPETREIMSPAPPLITKEKSFLEEKTSKALSWMLHQRVPNMIVPFPEMDRRFLLLSFELNSQNPKTQNDKSYPFIYSRSAIYDNALGIIALSMSGHDTEAKKIIDAFSRIVRDNGELWFSYNTHNEWPSEKDHEEAIIRNGASSWAAYAITFYIRNQLLKDPMGLKTDKDLQGYLQLAKKLADALLKDQVVLAQDPRFGFITGGKGSHELMWDKDKNKVIEKFKDHKIEWASIEHNLDLYFLLKNLAILTGEQKYEKAKAILKEALLKSWNEKEKQFNRGMRLTGADTAMALDCASWGILFLLSIGEDSMAKQAIYAMERYKILDPLAGIEGYRPYYTGLIFDELHLNTLFYPHKPQKSWSDIQMVWSEGSLGVAMTYLKMKQKRKAQKVLEQMAKMQVSSGGLKYSTQEIPFQFSPSPSMAGTAWFVMVSSALDNPQLLNLFWQ